MKRNALLILLVLLVSMRFVNISMPILEGTATRQVQTAEIARNYFRDGIDLLYPRTGFFGPGPGYLVLEFPLLNALSAVLSTAIGSFQEWTGRLFSIFFFAGAALFLYNITRRIFDRETAFWTVAVFGLSPLSVIFSRVFMPDFEMIFFCLGALYFALSYYNGGKAPRFWISAVFLSMALLIKPHSFYIGVPIVYLIWKGRGWRSVSDIRNWIYAGIAVVPALLWYRHAGIVHRLYNPEMAWTYEVATWFDPKRMFDPGLVVALVKIYGGIFLTPVGLALFTAGLFVRTEEKEKIVWAWLGGSILFLLACYTRIDDPYYNLNMLPAVSLFAARGIVFLKKPGTGSILLGNRPGKVIVMALFTAFWLRYSLYAYIVPKGYRYIPEAGRRVQQLTDKDDLVVASSAGGWHALYYCDRKGWILKLPGRDNAATEEAIRKLESFRERGAAYYVTPVISEFDSSPAFKDYMRQNYTIVERNDGRYAIFALRR